MSKRIDYGQIAAKLDYPTLEKKLEQLAQREPPKNRKTAIDLLEPLRERILALHRKGWSSQQLAEELKAAGVRRIAVSSVVITAADPENVTRSLIGAMEGE